MSEWTDVAPPPSSSYHPNVAKFLGVLGQAEGAGYGTIVGGKQQFSDYQQHPRVVGLRTAEGPSTAAGRYQITKTTYDDTAKKLGITDFSPASQDRIAIELIRQNGAYDDVVNGDYNAAMKKLGGVWASLPSSKYSQPKLTQAQFNNMTNQDDGWTTVAPAMKQSSSSDDGWTTVVPAKTQTVPPPGKVESAPLPDITPKQAQPAAPAATVVEKPGSILEQAAPIVRKGFRFLDDTVRGVADAMTFGYADEIAAKADSIFGGGQSGKTTYEEALKDQRKRDAEGGLARTTGQVIGSVLPSSRVSMLMNSPSRFARAGAGAATGAVQGGLYGAGSSEEGQRLEGAATGALLGGTTGGVLSGILPSTVTQVASGIKKKAGSEAAAAMDAEIIQDLSKIAKSEANRGEPVMAIHANALEQKYVGQANRALKDLGKDQLSKMGLVADDVRDAIQNRRILTTDELNTLRSSPAGEALASSIEKAQRTRSLTAQQSANPSLLAKGVRLGIEAAPTAIGGAVGGIPGAVVGALGTKAASNWAQRLTGKASREEVIQQLIKDKNVAAAGEILKDVGPSAATQSLEKLQGVAQKAQTANAARQEVQQAVKQQALDAGEQLRIRNLQMGIRSNPKFVQGDIGGGTRGTLQYYGRLKDSKELAKGLKIIEKTDPYLAPYIASIKQNKGVPNKDILLGLSDRLLKLREDGILKPYMK